MNTGSRSTMNSQIMNVAVLLLQIRVVLMKIHIIIYLLPNGKLLGNDQNKPKLRRLIIPLQHMRAIQSKGIIATPPTSGRKEESKS